MAFRPLPRGYAQQYQPVEPTPEQSLPVQEEKGILQRAIDDIKQTASYYVTGAGQAWDEMNRSTRRQTDALKESFQAGSYPDREVFDNSQQASKQFVQAVAEPIVLPAALVNPTAAGVAAPMVIDSAVNAYEEGGVGKVLRDFTYGGAADFINQEDLGQKFYDRPISTAAAGVMSVVPAALLGKSAYKGIKKIKPAIEQKSNALLDEFTSAEPIKGIDAVPEQLPQYQAENVSPLIQALREVNAKKFDEAAQSVPESRFAETPLVEMPKETAQQAASPLLQALEQVKAQKFDEANQQSYWRSMEREANEANAIQAQKNAISSEMLFSPADRLEVGADIPAKSRLAGEGVILGEQPQPSRIILPNETKPTELIANRPQAQEPAKPGFMRTAEDFIGERQKQYYQTQLKEAVKAKDFATASQLADKLGNPKLAEVMRTAQQQKPGGKLQSGIDPTGGRFDDVSVSDLANRAIGATAERIWNREVPSRQTRLERQQQSRTPVEYAISKWDKIYQATFDDKHPLSKVPGGDTLYKEARVANAKAHGVATEFLKGRTESLEQILEPVKGSIDDFSKYIESVHSADQYNAGLKTAMPVEEIINRMDSATPEFKQAQQRLVSYNNRLLDVLVDGGVLTRESVNAMKEKWKNYVPFMRDFSDTEAMESFIRSKGFINVSNPIKKLKGSERQIYDPLESIIKNTYVFTNIAERNKVGRTFTRLPSELLQAVEGKASDPKRSIFTVWENGEKKAYQTTPELYRALASLDDVGSNFIVDMLSVPAGTLRAGATLNPEFMARNLTRDALTGFINSQTGFIPIIDTLKGLSHALKKDDLFWEWTREGGGMSTMVSVDRNYLRNTVKDFKTKRLVDKAKTAIDPRTYLNALRTLSEYSELGTRLGVYGKARSKGFNPLDAIMDSREASLDFGRAGTHGRIVNKPVAFFNAALQDVDKMARLLSNKETRARTMANITLAVVLPSVATWYMGKDDERVQRLPAWQKDLFWIIPTKATGPGWDGLVRIPKPFGYGVLFGSGTERMLDYAYKKDAKSFKGYGGSVKDAFIPSLIPTAAIPLMEWWANKSYFSGHDIVPQREEKLPAKLQYGSNTTELAKYVGGKLDVSPRKIDNTVYGYTGGLGRQVAELTDFVAGGKNQPARSVTEYPIARGFTATSYRNSQPIQDFYNALKKQDELEAEAKFNKKKPMPTQTKRTLDNAEKVMREFNKQEKAARDSTSLTPDQKRKKIDELLLKQTRFAEAVMKKIK